MLIKWISLGLLPLADCEAQLTLKPFGTFDEIWGDNIVCRLVHIILAQVRPDVSPFILSPFFDCGWVLN